MTAPAAGAVTGYAAEAWANGPDRVYGRLAEALVERCPGPLAGARVLDLGAGTGAVSRALASRGAMAVAVDIEPGMLRHDLRRRPPAAAGDILALPFGDAVFDAVLASFVISHVARPDAALREAARVTRPGHPVLATSFLSAHEDPFKRGIEEVLLRRGYRRPEWYEVFKREREARVGDASGLADIAREAALSSASVSVAEIEVGMLDAAALVAWRFGMAHVAPFLAGLHPRTRSLVTAEAVAALGPGPHRLRLPVVFLVAVA